MSRYSTLLERLMALVPHLKPQDVLAAVQEAMKQEIRAAYEQAVTTHSSSTTRKNSVESICSPVSSPVPEIPAKSAKRQSTSSRRSPRRRSNRSSTFSDVTETSPALSSEDKEGTLAKQVEQVLKAELPLDVATIAFVARMVIVAWTVSVGVVAWAEGEAGFKVPDLEVLGKIAMS
jgi:hypothetical protein